MSRPVGIPFDTPPTTPFVRIWLGDPILPARSLAAIAKGGLLL